MEQAIKIKEENDEEKSDFKLKFDSYSLSIGNINSCTDDAGVSGVCYTEIKIKTEPQDCTDQLTDTDTLLRNVKKEAQSEEIYVVDDESLEDCQILDVTSAKKRKKIDESCSTSDNNNDRCPMCKENFDTFDSLKKHVEQEHVNERQFCCTECQKWFKDNAGLRQHFRSSHGEKKYKCEFCNYSTTIRYSLERHRLIIHLKEKPHKCPHCEYCAPIKEYLTDHIKLVHKQEKLCKCSICDMKFLRKADLKRHRRFVHLGEKPEIYLCEQCGYRSANPSKTEHKCVKKFSCDKCDYKTKNVVELKLHFRSAHGELYTCFYCHKKFALQSILSMHVSKVHGDVHKCVECGESFTELAELEQHSSSAHVKKTTFPCTMCDMVFFIQPDLKYHIKTKHK